ncbi:MAG: DUF4080 domain-containing protein [Burkholderiaceae bacterium]|nr:DUF4080 domain-containing protein [Burkholderiaceae bacterium]
MADLPISPVFAPATDVVLCTLNAKYIHASLGLRYLLANMGDLQPQTALCEFTIARQTEELAAELLRLNPKVIGFGVYIWNVTPTCALVKRLKAQRPDIRIVLGGPEVSHETGEQEIVQLADHVITGWGDVSFPKLCRALLYGPKPLMKVIPGEQPPLDQIALPYAHYSDADLAHRLLYVEASRGCPFKCEFCLSSLDKTAWAFDLELFLGELSTLYARGARNFKFVDRTFNLKIDASVRILQFFLDKLNNAQVPAGPPQGELAPTGGSAAREAASVGASLFVHFEVIPDHLPDRLKDMIARFPPGVLQFEVGIQSFNVDVQQRISRRQDNDKTVANLAWLVQQSNAHLHTDLIFGLPGESLASFGAGFDRLHALKPHEIQLGILKRLRGTPIARHTLEHGMVYDPLPPYQVQHTGVVSRPQMQRFVRLARYWDLVANSGRFKQTMAVLLDAPSPSLSPLPSPFWAFMAFSDWLWQSSNKTSGLTPEALVDALHDYLTTQRQLDAATVQATLLADYVASGARARPRVLHALIPRLPHPQPKSTRQLNQRQDQHAGQPVATAS